MRLRNPDEAKWLEQSGWLKLTPVQYRQVRKTPGQVFQVSWSSATKFCKLLGGPGCNRLIKNSIMCWNYLYLTQKITLAKTEEERKRLLDIIETHSPQSWASFNMLGEFDFSDEKLQDTTGVLPPKKQTEIIPENWGPPNR